MDSIDCTEVLLIIIEFFLRVHILKFLGSSPPFGRGLYYDGIGLEILDELLGSVGKHGALIHGSNEEDLSVIESLSQMKKSMF